MSAITNNVLVSAIQSFAQANPKTAMTLGSLTLVSTLIGTKSAKGVEGYVKDIPVLNYLPTALNISNKVYTVDATQPTKGWFGFFAYGLMNTAAAAALYFAYKG